MKVLTIAIKHKVIGLFLSGLPYDLIAQQVGISKGSVVNIVDEFREGYIQAPPGMNGYIDELRKMVVDLKKHNTTVVQLKGYAKLHTKMKAMGVDTGQLDLWLDICQEIAAPDASNKEFVSAALELAAVKEKTGQGYLATVEDTKKQQKVLLTLKDEMAKGEEEFALAKQEWVEDKSRAVKELQSITEAAKTAKEAFKEQKKQLKAVLDEYLVQNKLTWHKVKVATALLDTTLNNADLSLEQIKEVTGLIAEVASIHSLVQQLDKTKKEVEPEVDSLLRYQKELEHDNFHLEHIKQNVFNAYRQRQQEGEELASRIEKRKEKLNVLEQLVSA